MPFVLVKKSVSIRIFFEYFTWCNFRKHKMFLISVTNPEQGLISSFFLTTRPCRKLDHAGFQVIEQSLTGLTQVFSGGQWVFISKMSIPWVVRGRRRKVVCKIVQIRSSTNPAKDQRKRLWARLLIWALFTLGLIVRGWEPGILTTRPCRVLFEFS